MSIQSDVAAVAPEPGYDAAFRVLSDCLGPAIRPGDVIQCQRFQGCGYTRDAIMRNTSTQALSLVRLTGKEPAAWTVETTAPKRAFALGAEIWEPAYTVRAVVTPPSGEAS